MKIKLLVPLNGPNGGGIEGDVIDWADEEDCYRFIERGYAEFVPTLDEAVAAIDAEQAASEPVIEEPTAEEPTADEPAKPAKRTRKATK